MMENFPNMNNLNHKTEAPSVPEAAGHWEVGLDGEKFFVPTPRALFAKEAADEVIEDAVIIPEQVDKVARVISPILRDAISQGVTEGWDTATDKPSELFVERVGADMEKMVKERASNWKDEQEIYAILRSEPLPMQNEREQKMKDALLKRASGGKYAH